MSLLELIRAEAGPNQHRIMMTAVIAGIADTLILASINTAAQAPETADEQAFVLCGLFIALYVVCARHVNQHVLVLIEAVTERIKVRIGEKLACVELDVLENVKAAEICDRITENTSFITEVAGVLATMMQSGLIVFFAIFYLAWLSLPAAAIVILLCIVGALKFIEIRKEFVANVHQAMTGRVMFLERMMDLLAGFTELQFSRRRRREVREHVVQASDEVRMLDASADNYISDGILLGNAILFALLAGVVYTLPIYVDVDSKMLTNLVAVVTFLWGPFMGLTMGMMPYIRSSLALQEIATLEQKLEDAVRQHAPVQDAPDPWHGRITTLEAKDIEYKYALQDGQDTFRIGPIDLRIHAGEVLFIVGGNGSGKSTLLKVLTGLYPATAGTLSADGIIIGTENIVNYRNMISAIFSNFHLFPKLYGLASVDEAAVHRLLERMRLDKQTSFANGTFTKLTLSTGQKKRLAMVIALLEARPICVFDEWAADQDPEFRIYFYEDLLPMLRQEGKTVIVISHDDQYFHCADRVMTMEQGKIRSIEKPAPRAVTI